MKAESSVGEILHTTRSHNKNKKISMLMMLFSGFVVLLFSDFVECINNAINKTTRQQNNYTTKLFFELYGRKKPVLPLRPSAACLFRATNVLRCKTGFLFSFKSEFYQKSEKALSSKNQSWSLAPISS